MQNSRALRRALMTVVGMLAGLTFALTSTGVAAADSLGVDVSSWQHLHSRLDWGRVRADGNTFAFVKATEGTGYVNPYFARDWAGTVRAGLFRGAYHFARPRRGNARTQARFFLHVAGHLRGRGDLPAVLDLEVTGGLRPAALQQWTATWLQTVRRATGRKPIVYTSPEFWRTALGNTRRFADYPLWIAHYGVARPQVPGGWRTWTFWQGRRDGRVPGIGVGVDRNAFNGSLAGLRRLARAASLPVPRTRTRTHLGLHASAAAVPEGRTVKLYGHLATATGRPLPGRRVTFYKRQPGGPRWSRVTTVTTVAPTGWYQTYVAPGRDTVYRAVFGRTPRLRRFTSTTVRVSLR